LRQSCDLALDGAAGFYQGERSEKVRPRADKARSDVAFERKVA